MSQFKKYVTLSILEVLAISIYVVADTFFIARAMGQNGLTALNIAIVSFTVVHSLGLMVGIGGGAYFAMTKRHQALTQACYIGAGLSLVFMVLGAFFTPAIATALEADATIAPMVISYTRTILIFSPLLIFKNILLAFARNNGKPKKAMTATSLGAGVNIFLDYIFLFPLSLGMFGAALATVLGLATSIVYLVYANPMAIKITRPNLGIIKKTLALGASTAVGELTVAIALIIFNLVILNVAGNVGVAAYGIVMNLAIVVLSIFAGVAFGMQPLISQGYGSGDQGQVYSTLKYGLVLVLALGLGIYAMAFIAAPYLVMAFNSQGDATLQSLATTGIRIYFVGLIFAGVNMVAASYLSAANQPKKGFAIAILRSLVLIVPMLLLLSHYFAMAGVWTAFAVTELSVMILSAGVMFCTRPRFK